MLLNPRAESATEFEVGGLVVRAFEPGGDEEDGREECQHGGRRECCVGPLEIKRSE